MIFNSLVYFLAFLIPSAFVFRKVAPEFRGWVCCVAGSLFFVYFSLTTVGGKAGAWCLALILWQSFCCLRFCRPGSRACIAVVAQALLALCVFKYANFFGGVLFGTPTRSPFYWKDAFLPLGISFFTFEFIHYAVDVYKGKTTPARAGDFLGFILFFPTMVAGPIKRVQDFVPKLYAPGGELVPDFHRGLSRILWGLARKFAVADLLTSFTNNLNRNDIAHAHGRVILVVWLLAYGVKIYFDFSAYSDIAIGSARLFGIRVPENFDAPYAQTNISQFWQHWHISLYRWLIDYIFIPLGGSRVSPALIYRNLIVVMMASGLWHGAGGNFLAWGAWHALLLSIHRWWDIRTRGGAAQNEGAGSPLVTRTASWLLTFACVNIGWALFAMDLPTCALFFRRLIIG